MSYVEYSMRGSPARLVSILCECDELLGEALCLLGFGVSRLNVFMLDELCDQTAKKGLARGRVAAEMPVLDEASCHGD